VKKGPVDIEVKVRPTFLYIGVARSGSTWLYEIMREHPDVFVPPAKDIQFFDIQYERGLDWYLRFFKDGGGYQAVGEVSHDYYLAEEYAERILTHLPEVRLICCLREPLSKLVSGYHYNITTEYSGDLSFDAYVAKPEVKRQIEYSARLRPFYQRFARERLLVLFYDELLEKPEEFVRTVYSFIGVDKNFKPPSLHKRVNPSRKVRKEAFAHAAFYGARLVRKLGYANVVGKIKHNTLINALLYESPKSSVEVADGTVRALRESWQDELMGLQELIGRPLPETWR
jgi:hypothetical protein